MAVIFKSDLCYLLDHKKFLDDIYSDCCDFRQCSGEKHRAIKLAANEIFFDIQSPFLMDTQAIKCVSKPKVVESNQIPNLNRKKRKRKIRNISHEDAEDAKYHKQIMITIEQAFSQMQNFIKTSCSFISEPSPFIKLYNNAGARAAGKMITESNFDANSLSLLKKTACHHHSLNFLSNGFVKYEGDQPGVFGNDENAYVLPPQCSFLISSLNEITQLLSTVDVKFNVIVVDPPWNNKSVKRKKSYNEIANDDLLTVPVPQLAASDCLVLVWVTNKMQQIDFVKFTLFPSWNVRFVAEWHWLKVTRAGCPVMPLNSLQKKPYEHLIVGTIGYEQLQLKTSTIISVPSTIHSQKPPLTAIIDEYLSEDKNCLELFARSLLPGWTSWGNEVLKLQKLNKLLNEGKL